MAPPEIWGPPVWNFIHTLAEKVNEDYFNVIKTSLFSIIKRICIYFSYYLLVLFMPAIASRQILGGLKRTKNTSWKKL